MNPLRQSRMAAAAMIELVKHLQIGNLAKRFDGDNPAHWLVVDETEVRCIDRGELVATLYTVAEGKTTIVVENAYSLIRPNHVSDFNPRERQIRINNVPDWKGETAADLIATLTVPNPPEYDAPRRPIPPYTTIRKPRYNGSL